MSRQGTGLVSRRYPAGRPGGVTVVGLRVAVLAPISWRTPPVHYGPWELFASLLTEGLVQRGHRVTLFATGDSCTEATLSSVVPHGWSDDPDIDTKVRSACTSARCSSAPTTSTSSTTASTS